MSGTSASGDGVALLGSNSFTNSGGGSFSVTGTNTGANNNAFSFITGASLTTSGNMTLSGTIPITGNYQSDGVFFQSANSVTDSAGNLTIHGTAVNATGVFFNTGAMSLTNSGGGTFAVNGNSSTFWGIGLNTGVSLTSHGNLTLTGVANSGQGVFLNNANTVADAAGNLTINATSNSSFGFTINQGNNTLSNSGGTFAINGTSGTLWGVFLNDNVGFTSTGNISLTGNSNSSFGINFNNANSVTDSSGILSLVGTSTSSNGVWFNAATTTLTNSGGTLSMSGVSGSGNGIAMFTGTGLTTSGTMAISGSSTSGNGFVAQGSDAVTISGGALTINGTTASGAKAGFDTSSSGNSITNNGVNNGTRTLTLNGTGGDRLGATISSTAGDVVISDTGAVTQSGGTITAGNLLLSGTGSFALAQANRIGTIAANVGSVSFNNNQALTTGTVQGKSGIAATGAVTVTTTAGNLTIAAAAPITGASAVLATAAAFINNAGGSAVTATAGRWLIYSNAPGGDTFGGLNSLNTAIWNATYASFPPASVAASGNRYLFATQPTLTFTSTNASKTYGTDATSLITGNYAIGAYQNGVAGAFLTDTAANVFSGAPAVTSTGAAPGASVAGGPYAMSIAQGALSALSGYAFSYVSSGQLAVGAAPVSVTAVNGFSTYGSFPANAGLSATGLQNGQSVSVLTGLSNGITNTTNAGSYTANVTGALTNSNYTVAGTTSGGWTVNPAPVSVTALGGSSTYGSSPANPGLSATGLQNGDSVAALTGLGNSFGISNISNAGSYVLNVAGTLTNSNYSVASTTNGSWIVNPASVTVTALGGSSTYGSSPANPGLSATGLQNGDTASALTGLGNSFGISSTSNAGSYTLSVAGTLTNSNYNVVGLTNGSWTVNAASVNVTALNGSSTYGSLPANAGLSATGLQNGDSVSALTGLSNGISGTSNAGSYTANVTGTLTNSNYTVGSATSGSWTVNPAFVTVTAASGSSSYGSSPTNPGLSATGLQNGQNAGVLTGLSNSFGISNTSNAGSYTLNVAGTLTNSNYSVA
ncbi:beta strand repeat-containing protein, partial [Bradyrhizobium sp.]|uniref:beta strand repeat-containing protein n=1 Tax=Bradyrhizobium sp. TaxID=376 RepID=UPI003C1D747C